MTDHGGLTLAYPMSIAGRAVAGPATFDVYDPATGEVTGSAPDCSAGQLDEAMTAAQDASRDWAADAGARAEAMLAAAEAIEAAADDAAPVLTREMGKPLPDTRREVLGAASYFRYYAGQQLPREVIRSDASVLVELLRRPVGPVAAITPWNGPLLMFALKAAPALAAGNPVVVKPSPVTPLATLLVAGRIRELFPAGVLSVVTGTDDLGRWMTEHPVPRMLTFTGSIEIGRKVAMAAARGLKRSTLELGGNDPVVVLDDVNVADLASRLTRAAFYNCGQICIAPKRVYVPGRVYTEVVEALADAARAVQTGNGLDEGVQMGPLATPQQRDFVAGLVEDALAAGGTLVTGGPLPGPGNFYAPTIVADVDDQTRLVAEEQFGPALPVVRYDDVGTVVDTVNRQQYGLGASVWSADPGRAAAVADQIDAGQVWINTHFASIGAAQPTTGVKSSGIGIEGGPWGMLEYTDAQMRYTYRG